MANNKNGLLDPVSDKSLMLKVKAGDIDKLGLLYERYNKDLFRYFWYLTASTELSEDLVQNVFYRILKHCRQYRGKGKFISWMYSIARNLWADHYKKNKRLDAREDLPQWYVDDELPADEQIEREEKLRQLRSALDRLDPEKKEVLVLSRYQGLKYHEIADLLNTTEGAVKTKVFRALNELKEIYIKMEN
jgi:RNA polymerase sigma factor (sigma-70 family)